MDKWVCKICGNEIYEKPYKNQVCKLNGCKGRFIKYTQCKCGKWHYNKNDKKYCSSECSGRKPIVERKGKIKLTCTNCKKEFERYAGNVKSDRLFCSLSCKREYFKANKVLRKCKQCGKEFEVYKSAIEKSNASGNYCCTECYYKSMEVERIGRYGAEFSRMKRKHFSNNPICAVCGTPEKIHIHHIVPFRLTQDNSISNLIPLCAKHHIIVERATFPIVEHSKDLEKTKLYLNIILRNRQLETYNHFKERENKNEKRIYNITT